LYNVANDRTELNNLATAEPKRLQAMIKTWKRMAHDVLHSPRNADSPIQPTVLPHANREWTKFDPNPPQGGGSPRKSRAIRARKNTKLTWKSGNMELEFSGDNPGIAMDLRSTKLAQGPYVLTFRLSTKIRGTGEVFFTINPQQILPRGERVTFDVDGSDDWQEIRIELPTNKSLKQLRIDVADGPGKATLSALKLSDAKGTTLKQWSAPRR
jgi:arylsulfatase